MRQDSDSAHLSLAALRGALPFAARALAFVFVLSVIWLPAIEFYHVRAPDITRDMMDRARAEPSSSVLDELAIFRVMATPPFDDNAALIQSANSALIGEVGIQGFGSHRISLPFDPRDLEVGLPSWQLSFAALHVPRTLLDAFRLTHDAAYLEAARDILVAFAKYEDDAWLDRGFLWNDHAVAERVYVLSYFWSIYREHESFDYAVAEELLGLVARSAKLLSDKRHFTAFSNHGVIQNLALWHICASFPSLPGAENYKQLALERLADQNSFHLNEEGVILEHSPGYHATGMAWLGMALRYASILGLREPVEWQERYEGAKAFHSLMARPDGSLPVIGDTASGPVPAPRVAEWSDSEGAFQLTDVRSPPAAASSLFPKAGYAVWWNGLDGWPIASQLEQTVVAWSNYPYLGHKHADELSIVMWAGGVDWWSGVGYWPYGVPGRDSAVSWPGSNAPHLSGEPANSDRSTVLLHSSSDQQLRVLDLQRSGPGGFSARRQIVYPLPGLWIVLDSTTGEDGQRASTIWNTSAGVSVGRTGIDGLYELSPGTGSARLRASIVGSTGTHISLRRGSLSPFAGWQIVNSQPQPADAVEVLQAVNGSWALSAWRLHAGPDDTGRMTAKPVMLDWAGADKWRVSVPLAGGDVIVSRTSETVRVEQRGASEFLETTLVVGEDVSEVHSANRHAFEVVERKYPRFLPHLQYRERVTWVVLALFLAQEVVLPFFRRFRLPLYLATSYTGACAWVVLGIWLGSVYFRS